MDYLSEKLLRQNSLIVFRTSFDSAVLMAFRMIRWRISGFRRISF
ncbi:MAG: hypothetical protein AAF551_14865 [Bacteroidota bacterium]